MSTMGLWAQIPDESWVKVWAEGTAGDQDPGFTVDGVFHDSANSNDPLNDLHLKPSRRKLRTPLNYTVRATVSFAKQSTAFVLAEVTDKDGAVIPEGFSEQAQFRSSKITGKTGSAKSVTLFLITRLGEGGDIE